MFKKMLENYYIKKYIKNGIYLGDILSYSYMESMGYEAVGKKELIIKFLKLEKKVFDLGFKIYSMENFIEAGGYGKELPKLCKRECLEEYQVSDYLILELFKERN